MVSPFSTKQLDTFHKAAVSLKLFSRAELNDERNRSLIEKLYVDPLPNDQVFKTLLASNTCLLVGRKGSGKSTVFQRVQHEIRKNKSNVISTYMDIRNVFEASQIDPVTADRLNALADAMAPEQIQKFLLYKRFFKTLISDIRDELKAQVDQNFLTRLRDRVTGTSAEVFSGLDHLITELDNPNYENIDGFVKRDHTEKDLKKTRKKNSLGGRVKVVPTAPEASVRGEFGSEKTHEDVKEDTYTQLMMRVIGVNEVIGEIAKILNALGIKRYIYS